MPRTVQRWPTQPTTLTDAQARRVRTIDNRLLIATGAVIAAQIALSAAGLSKWLILPVAAAAYAPCVHWSWRFRKSLGMTRTEPIIPPHPQALHHFLAIGYAYAAVGVIGYGLASGKGFDPSMMGVHLGLGAAMGLAWASHASYRLTPPSCPGCDYPLGGLAFPTACPECGRTVEDASQAVTCRRIGRRSFRVAAAACVVVPVTLSMWLMVAPGVVTTRLPRAARMALATTDEAAFGSVVGTLNPDEYDRMADRLLDARPTADRWRFDRQLAWLGAEHTAGRLSPQQSDRFASDGYRIEIAADPVRRVGVPLTIGLTGDAPAYDPMTASFWFVIRGFEIDGRHFELDPNPFLAIALNVSPRENLATSPLMQPVVFFTPDRPGPVRVTAEILAVSMPAMTTPSATWDPDQGWQITPPPLTTHTFRAETTLTITE